jgi:hypothetical protein
MARQGHAFTYDSLRRECVLFGGNREDTETWAWDGSRWTLREPGIRIQASEALVYDSARHRTLHFGNARQTSDWDGSNWTVRNADGPARRATGMSYDSRRDVAVLFSGVVPPGQPDDTWELNGTWERVATDGPGGRWGHRLAYDETRDVTVLFGGFYSANSLTIGDTWEWDGASWTQVHAGDPAGISAPLPTFFHAMAYDRDRGMTVLFGGSSESQDTWEWNGNTWTRRATVGPSGRMLHALVYDSVRQVTLLIGGGSPISDETWEWNGSVWTQLAPTGIPPNGTTFAAYDTDRRVVVAVAGSTWELLNRSGDLNDDGAVSIADLAILLAHFGTPDGALYTDGDLDGDGDVDLQDLANLLANFGTTCP